MIAVAERKSFKLALLSLSFHAPPSSLPLSLLTLRGGVEGRWTRICMETSFVPAKPRSLLEPSALCLQPHIHS